MVTWIPERKGRREIARRELPGDHQRRLGGCSGTKPEMDGAALPDVQDCQGKGQINKRSFTSVTPVRHITKYMIMMMTMDTRYANGRICE